MNLNVIRAQFHALIDETENPDLLEHFYLLLSNLKNEDSPALSFQSDEEYNYSDIFEFDEN